MTEALESTKSKSWVVNNGPSVLDRILIPRNNNSKAIIRRNDTRMLNISIIHLCHIFSLLACDTVYKS